MCQSLFQIHRCVPIFYLVRSITPSTLQLTGNLQDYRTETHLLGRLLFWWCRRQWALVGAGGRAAGRRYVLQLRCRVAAVVVALLVSYGRRC